MFSGSFGLTVDERKRNKLYGVKLVEFIYLATRLARQWIKERGIIDMRVPANEPNEPARLMHGAVHVFCGLALFVHGTSVSYLKSN